MLDNWTKLYVFQCCVRGSARLLVAGIANGPTSRGYRGGGKLRGV